MSHDEIMRRLSEHPDAARQTPDTEKGRAQGFQCLLSFPSGAMTAVYHWGCRPFTNQAQLEAWLQRQAR